MQLGATATLLFLAPTAHAQSSPAGQWRTISDSDGKPGAVVEIREVDGLFVGVVRTVLAEGETGDAVCDKCDGERKGQRIVGMQILWGMRPDGDEWTGGSILDPDNGKVYRAKMHLEDGGRKLIVRGFVGFSLFGRSQTWLREE
jgi:uncharacterized protein (DUF2147 family)